MDGMTKEEEKRIMDGYIDSITIGWGTEMKSTYWLELEGYAKIYLDGYKHGLIAKEEFVKISEKNNKMSGENGIKNESGGSIPNRDKVF